MSETPEELRERMSRAGKVGGKRRLVTMSKAKRYHLAYTAGVQGGRPIVIDHPKVQALWAQGLKHREIAEQMKISLTSVYRILAER